MGAVDKITADTFPKQGEWLHKRCEVCFHYDTSKQIGGTIVRDDAEAPGRTIIKLDDGRYVLTTECQHTMPKAVEPAPVVQPAPLPPEEFGNYLRQHAKGQHRYARATLEQIAAEVDRLVVRSIAKGAES